MLNREKFKELQETATIPVTNPAPLPLADDLKLLKTSELLALRERIISMLPATQLTDMNLEQEVVLLFLTSRELLHNVMTDEEIPVNQKAQVANSCSANLQQLVKMQTELYTSERIKAIESALMRTLKTLPEEVREQFLTEYQKSYSPPTTV